MRPDEITDPLFLIAKIVSSLAWIAIQAAFMAGALLGRDDWVLWAADVVPTALMVTLLCLGVVVGTALLRRRRDRRG